MTVRFAILQVAGRMPGTMDVMLAEAGVPYGLNFHTEDINPVFKTADVSLVLRANDMVKSAARTNKASPILRDADARCGQGKVGL